MNIQITNINIQYENDELSNVQIYFSGHDDERTVHLNGFIPLSSEEYIENETIYTKFLMQRLKEIQNTISLRKINGRIDQNWNQCPICLGNFNKKDNEISLPDCLHTFHESCLRKWICERPVCPCCRSDLRSKFQVPWEQTAY